MKPLIISLLIFFLTGHQALAGRTPIQNIAQEPYASALLLNAGTGKTLFAENADTRVYPASTLKMMVLLIILERVEQGMLHLEDMVQVTVEAYKMGGSQVYLDPSEQFSVDDLLYALMVQSANDAAVALATHVAGSKEAFVALMNHKAAELGMVNTRFYSVHGLPPASGQKVDVTTAGDFGILSRELVRHPEVFDYTSVRVRDFRGGDFIMRTHNHLLEKVEGCDGFKTGYFTAAGFSIVATASRNGVRIIAIVMGSKDRKVRDAKAIELLARGFAMVPAQPETAALESLPVSTQTAVKPALLSEHKIATSVVDEEEKTSVTDECGWSRFFMGTGVGFVLFTGLYFLVLRKRTRRNRRLRRL
jgi:D-alanyl-D-alanine carboxypeptidase (penicillin-binding protein 5/6)